MSEIGIISISRMKIHYLRILAVLILRVSEWMSGEGRCTSLTNESVCYLEVQKERNGIFFAFLKMRPQEMKILSE